MVTYRYPTWSIPLGTLIAPPHGGGQGTRARDVVQPFVGQAVDGTAVLLERLPQGPRQPRSVVARARTPGQAEAHGAQKEHQHQGPQPDVAARQIRVR